MYIWTRDNPKISNKLLSPKFAPTSKLANNADLRRALRWPRAPYTAKPEIINIARKSTEQRNWMHRTHAESEWRSSASRAAAQSVQLSKKFAESGCLLFLQMPIVRVCLYRYRRGLEVQSQAQRVCVWQRLLRVSAWLCLITGLSSSHCPPQSERRRLSALGGRCHVWRAPPQAVESGAPSREDMLRPDLRPPDRPASNYQESPQGPDPTPAAEAPDTGNASFLQYHFVIIN